LNHADLEDEKLLVSESVRNRYPDLSAQFKEMENRLANAREAFEAEQDQVSNSSMYRLLGCGVITFRIVFGLAAGLTTGISGLTFTLKGLFEKALGVGGFMGGFLGTIGGTILVGGLAGASIDIATCCGPSKAYAKFESIQAQLDINAGINRDLEEYAKELCALAAEADRIDDLKLAWLDFENSPEESKVAALVAKVQSFALSNCNQLFPLEQPSKELFMDSALFAVEEMCRILKTGTLVSNWRELQKPSNDPSWEAPDLSYWNSFGIEIPNPRFQWHLFTALTSYKTIAIVNKISELFAAKQAKQLDQISCNLISLRGS